MKFPSAEKLQEAIAQVAELANLANQRVILIGGCAMALYGSDRLTHDVDFASNSVLQGHVGRTKKLLFGGEQFTVAGVPVDYVVRSDDFATLYQAAIAGAKCIEGVPMLVVRPEHLVAMKMAAGRDKDLSDISHLLGTEGLVDRVLARKIVREHMGAYAAQEFDGLVEEADWKRARAGK